MTVSSPVVSPLLIQSSKLIEWLLSRKLLQKDYPKRLVTLEDQVNKQIETLPENISFPTTLPSTFIACTQTYEAIQKADTQTDFFGRASHSVRKWRDIVEGYKKQNVHIAELGEALQELASVSVPKCKGKIADEQKHITDLRQKIKEYTINVTKQEDMVEKAFREFAISLDESQIKLRLLEQAVQVFPLLEEIVESLKELTPAVELYESMNDYVRSGARSANKEKDISKSQCCSTLKLLITSGHVRLYTWQTGHAAEQWGRDDDWVPDLLAQEQALQQSQCNEAEVILSLDVPQSIDADTNEIAWDENGIDFGAIEVETNDGTPVEIDLDVEGVNPLDHETVAPSSHKSIEVPSGKNTRLLLDTVQGRTALLNDLVELGAFLSRFGEDLSECQDADEEKSRNTSTQGGSVALQQIILQNAPARLQSVSSKEVSNLLDCVESLRGRLTNSSLSQLLMIRSKPGFLDRLVTRLQDMRNQVERSRRRVAEAQMQIDEATAEQEQQAAVLLKHRSDCKQLVALLEDEISKLCNRPVQLIGQVLNL